MRAALMLLCLLLASCDLSNENDRAVKSEEANRAPQLVLSAMEVKAKALLDKHDRQRREVEGFEKRVKGAMEAVLLDPFSAEYRELRSGKNGAVCGEVNGKNRMGAYVGFRDFVLGRDGETVYISRYADGVESEQYTSFAEAYVNVCASRNEASRYAALTTPRDWGFSDDYDYAAEDAAAAAEEAADAAMADAEANAEAAGEDF